MKLRKQVCTRQNRFPLKPKVPWAGLMSCLPKEPAGSYTACAENERGREETSVSEEKNDTGNVGLALCGDAAGCRCAVEMPNWALTHPVSGSTPVTTDGPIQPVSPGNPCLYSVRRDWLKSRKATQRSGAPLKQLHTDPKCGMPGIVEPRRSFSSPVGPR